MDKTYEKKFLIIVRTATYIVHTYNVQALSLQFFQSQIEYIRNISNFTIISIV